MSIGNKKAQLKARLEKLEPQLKKAEEEKDKAIHEHGKLNGQVKRIKKQIESYKVEELTLSDHALLRYLERCAGIDVDQIRQSILSSKLKGQVKAFGGVGKFPLGEGVKAVVRDNVIVTIITKEKPTKKKR